MSGCTTLLYLNTLGFSYASIFTYGDQQTEAASVAGRLQDSVPTTIALFRPRANARYPTWPFQIFQEALPGDRNSSLTMLLSILYKGFY